LKWIQSSQNKNNTTKLKAKAHVNKKMFKSDSTISLLVFYLRLNKVYEEYFLSDLQKVAMTKFIKTHFSNKDTKDVDRVRPWLLAKMNGQRIPPQS